MAYSTGSYTGIDNALALFYAWAATNGWTQNYTGADGTGTRAHISKTIDGTACFFNLRSATAESISPLGTITGIAVNGSTAWDGSGTAWNQQTGFTTTTYGGATAAAGVVSKLITTGGTYHFFASATTLSAAFETESTYSDWRFLVVGNMNGAPSYFASGGTSTADDARSSFCSRAYTTSVSNLNNHAAAYVSGEGWYNLPGNYEGNLATRRMGFCVPSPEHGSTDPQAYQRGSTAACILGYSPDSFRGNAQLAPSQVVVTKGTLSEYWPLGEIEGVKFINMTNYSNGDEITYGSDTYKLFRIYNPAVQGVALLK